MCEPSYCSHLSHFSHQCEPWKHRPGDRSPGVSHFSHGCEP